MPTQRRYQLLLGKFRVTRVWKDLGQLRMAIDLPSLGKLLVDIPLNSDVREGDVLTLYTEVLSANPIPTRQ